MLHFVLIPVGPVVGQLIRVFVPSTAGEASALDGWMDPLGVTRLELDLFQGNRLFVPVSRVPWLLCLSLRRDKICPWVPYSSPSASGSLISGVLFENRSRVDV